MNIVTLILFALLILVPYVAIMVAIAIVSYQAKLRSVSNYIKSRENQSDKPRTIKRPFAAKALLLFLGGFLCVGSCLATLMIGRYLDVPWLMQIDNAWFGVVLIAVIILGAVAVVAGSILYKYLFKIEE